MLKYVQFWIFFAISIGAVLIGDAVILSYTDGEQLCVCPPCPREIEYKAIDEITFVTVPMQGSREVHKLAIASWLSVSDKSRVVILGERDSLGEVAEELEKVFGSRIVFAGPPKRDFKNVPYVDSWFRSGIAAAKAQFVCFVCENVVLGSDWMKRTAQVFGAMNGLKPFLIGQSAGFSIDPAWFASLEFGSDSFLSEIDGVSRQDDPPTEVTWFAFRTDVLPFKPDMIPPFLLGYPEWSEWLVGYMNAICDTVSFGASPLVYRVEIDRPKLETEDSRAAVNHNTKLSNGNYSGSNADTVWEVVGDQIVHRSKGTKIQL